MKSGGTISIDGTKTIGGNGQIVAMNSITDTDAAKVVVSGNVSLQAGGVIILADTPNASWRIAGVTTVSTPGDVSLGQGGSWDSNRLLIAASNAVVSDVNDVTLGDHSIANNFSMTSGGSISVDGTMTIGGNSQMVAANSINDTDAARVVVSGNASLQAGIAITLADTANAAWRIAGVTTVSTPGDVSLGQSGSWDSNRLLIAASNATVLDINDVTLGDHSIVNNYSMTSGGSISVDGTMTIGGNGKIVAVNSITDTGAARVVVSGDALLKAGGPITLADTANASWRISGVTNVSTPGDVNLGQAGSWDSNRLLVAASNAVVSDVNDVTLGDQTIVNNYSMKSGGTISVDGTMSIGGNGQMVAANSITDTDAARVVISGDALLKAGGPITLADTLNASWWIDGTTTVTTPSDVSLGQGGSWDSNRLLIAASNAVVSDMNDVTLGDHSIANNFSMTSGGSISVDGTMTIGGNSQMVGANSITDTDAARVVVSGNASLQAGIAITLADTANASWRIAGVTAVSTPGDVGLGQGGGWDSNRMRVDAYDASVRESDDLILEVLRILNDFRLYAFGEVADSTAAQLQVDDEFRVVASRIQLSDDAGDRLIVGGAAFLQDIAGGISIGKMGFVSFGSIGLLGTHAEIAQDTETRLDGVLLQWLALESVQRITQTGLDTGAGVCAVVIHGNAHFDFSSAIGAVELIRASTNPSVVLSDGDWMDNFIGGTISADHLNGNFQLRNIAASPILGALNGRVIDLVVWNPMADIEIGRQLQNAFGSVDLIAGMDVLANARSGACHAVTGMESWSFITNPHATVTTHGIRLDVASDMTVLAASTIRLSDRVTESLVVAGTLSVVSWGGGDIHLGGAGLLETGSLGVSSQPDANRSVGDVQIRHHGDLSLVEAVLPAPDVHVVNSHAKDLTVQSSGDIEDTSSLRFDIEGYLRIGAFGDIRLADHIADSWSVIGVASIESANGSIDVGRGGTVHLADVTAYAHQGRISFGGGWVSLGDLSLFAKQIAVDESTSTTLVDVFATETLSVRSMGSITNTQLYDAIGQEGVYSPIAEFYAASYVHLSGTKIGAVDITAMRNGELIPDSLFSLNQVADRVGQKYLGILGSNLPPGISASNRLISGETVSDLYSRASYIESIGRDYGVFFRNAGSVEIGHVNAFGDTVNVLLETLPGNSLTISGGVSQVYFGQSPGKIVLISGAELSMNPGASVEIVASNLDPSTLRHVLHPELTALAFDGGRGPATGFLSTRDILYAADLAADNGTQNVLQRLSTQVGIKGEYGFQILIQYADGKSQLFDNYSELYDSLRAGNPSTLWNGTIPAHIATSDAAVAERAVPFSDSFLASFQTLPTTAVFRRSSEIFLFENGGLQDASVRFIDLTPQSDFVDDVYAPGRKMSLPMPTEIVVTPTILSAPVRALPVIETTYPSITGDVEMRNVTENAVEVIVIRVGFDDRNQDGQPDSTELPDRGEVQVVMLKSAEMQEILRRASKLPSVRTNLLNGELELETKDTKGVMIPSASDIDRWVEDYRNNPSKPAGAYAIITLDPSMGVRVLKVFSVRDFDSKNEELPIVTKEDGVAEEEDRSKNTGIEEQGKP
jgi:hypothetical protein